MDMLTTSSKDGVTVFYMISGREQLHPWLNSDCEVSAKYPLVIWTALDAVCVLWSNLHIARHVSALLTGGWM